MPTYYERLDYGSPDGAQICGSGSERIGFYGAVPVSRRPFVASLHNTTAAATSSDFGPTQLAILQEIQNTLLALGIWGST